MHCMFTIYIYIPTFAPLNYPNVGKYSSPMHPMAFLLPHLVSSLPLRFPEEYTGMLDCARKTVAQHGPQGLYRGALPLILGSSGKQAARWTGYETAANAMKDFGSWVKTYGNWKRSVFEKILKHTSLLACMGETQFVWICIWWILVYESIFVLVTQSHDSYDSVFNTWGSSSLGRTDPLNRQAQLSQSFQDDQGKLTIPKRMLAGACGGVSEAILAVTPIETLKTRVTDDVRRGTKNYTGSFDAVMKILKSEGPAGLYMGFSTLTLMINLWWAGLVFFCVYIHGIYGGIDWCVCPTFAIIADLKPQFCQRPRHWCQPFRQFTSNE